jgi:hypothetical protein
MKRTSLLIGLVVIFAAVLASGCASYTVQNVPSQIDESKVVKAGDNDISITALPILTEEDSKKYFDYDLVAKNVLSVYLVIVNHSQSAIQFISSQVDSGNGKMIEPFPQKDVYKLIRREYAGKASAWFLISYGLGGPISAGHTASVNTKIEEDINKKHLNFGEIKPREFQQGFAWFKLPDDVVLEEMRGKKLALKMIFKKNGKPIEHDLIFPAPKKEPG